MIFWLGTHRASWVERTDVPLMLSSHVLAERKTLPRARGPLMIDSGGFTEIKDFGEYRVMARAYAALGTRYVQEIGNIAHLAIQDWMCEPFMLERTGLSLRTHQSFSVASYLELRDRAPALPWMPVLQGWAPADYARHVDMYLAAGVDLAELPVVGLGSICRRQHLAEARYTIRLISRGGIRLHGLGMKSESVAAVADVLDSSDSTAWSQDARRDAARWRRHGYMRQVCPGQRRHTLRTGCANCFDYAMAWRTKVLQLIDGRSEMGPLFA